MIGEIMKNITKAVSVVLFLFALIMLVSCGRKKPEWKGTIRQENGVTVVKNPKEPIYGEDVFSLEEELSIGEAEGREEYMFSQVGGIVVDEEERIYVADLKETHIKVFTKDGEYLKTIGRKGQGPGEFERVSGIQITYQKELIVFDMNIRRLSFFSPNGKFIKALSVSKLNPFRLNSNSKGNFLVQSVTLDLMNNQSISELKIYDSNLNYLLTIGAPVSGDIFNPFDPFFIWRLGNNNNIVYSYNKTYELRIYDSEGKIIKKIAKDYDPVRITEEEKKEAIEKFSPPSGTEFPKFKPAFNQFILDDEGRVFVQTFKRTEEGSHYYDVFDPEGKYIAKVLFRWKPRVCKKNKLYTVEEDEEGFQFVKRYKVTWKY